jgi:ketosteroid isomerase-like protein
LSLLGVVLMTGGAVAGTPASEPAGEEAAIARIVEDSIRWALTKDRALQESTMAHDEDLFIVWVDSKTRVTGWRDYVKLFDHWMDPRFKATVTEVRDLQVHVSRSGDVAWYSAMLDDLGEWDGKPTGAKDIRWTGVLERRDGRWAIVQMHGSVARDTVLKEAGPQGGGQP